MSISFAMIVFGAILIVAGWQDLSVAALARGDNTQPKPPIIAGGAGATSATTGTGSSPSSSSRSSGYAQGSGANLH